MRAGGSWGQQSTPECRPSLTDTLVWAGWHLLAFTPLTVRHNRIYPYFNKWETVNRKIPWNEISKPKRGHKAAQNLPCFLGWVSVLPWVLSGWPARWVDSRWAFSSKNLTKRTGRITGWFHLTFFNIFPKLLLTLLQHHFDNWKIFFCIILSVCLLSSQLLEI